MLRDEVEQLLLELVDEGLVEMAPSTNRPGIFVFRATPELLGLDRAALPEPGELPLDVQTPVTDLRSSRPRPAVRGRPCFSRDDCQFLLQVDVMAGNPLARCVADWKANHHAITVRDFEQIMWCLVDDPHTAGAILASDATRYVVPEGAPLVDPRERIRYATEDPSGEALGHAALLLYGGLHNACRVDTDSCEVWRRARTGELAAVHRDACRA